MNYQYLAELSTLSLWLLFPLLWFGFFSQFLHSRPESSATLWLKDSANTLFYAAEIFSSSFPFFPETSSFRGKKRKKRKGTFVLRHTAVSTVKDNSVFMLKWYSYASWLQLSCLLSSSASSVFSYWRRRSLVPRRLNHKTVKEFSFELWWKTKTLNGKNWCSFNHTFSHFLCSAWWCFAFAECPPPVSLWSYEFHQCISSFLVCLLYKLQL